MNGRSENIGMQDIESVSRGYPAPAKTEIKALSRTFQGMKSEVKIVTMIQHINARNFC